ncbi:MAG TPA: hypothetical protein PK280_04665 [Planctomycetota bacterium]|nr:hypothetical protein [Planctomycetota bacterium]
MRTALGIVATFLLAGGAPLAAEVGFSVKPAVAKDGDKAKISFSVSAPTDVEVAVLDGQGKVVRHLAAGVLGAPSTGSGPAGAPPEPLKAGLAQALEWDGRDDAGKPAAGGPFKVRVKLGLKPEFDGFLLDNPVGTGAISALAAGPGGQLYVWHHDCTANGNQGGEKLKIIGRDGKYVRTLIPYPANLPAEKAKVLGAFTDEDGSLVPRVYNMQQLNLNYEGRGDRGPSMMGFSCPAVDSKGRAYWLVAGCRLECVEADGSSPYETFLSPPLFTGFKAVTGRPALCMASDEKGVYVAGLASADDGWGKNQQPLPCVWRVDVATRKAEVFVGDLKEAGKEKDRLTAPRGVAAAKGLLYVADPGADRVAVFREADRSFVGEIKVKDPQSLGVDPATGAVYVCAYTGKQTADLIKFDKYETGKELCKVALPKTGLSPNGGVHRIVVDASAKPVLVYAPGLPYGPPFTCIEDAGDKFASRPDPRDLKRTWAPGPRDLTFDRPRGELYVKGGGDQRYFRVEEKTGKVTELVKIAGVGDNGTQLAVAPDGSLVTYGWGAAGLRRLDRDGKPANWPGRSTNAISYSGIMTFMQRNLALPSMEEIFIILPPEYRKDPKASGGDYSSVNVLGTDGATKRTVIWQCTVGAVLRMDGKGNIYLADMLKPTGRLYPEFFDGKIGKIPAGKSVGGLSGDPEGAAAFWESNMYASIIKFPPSGGVIWYNKDLPPCVEGAPPAELLAKPKQTFGTHLGYSYRPADVQGAEWVRFGFSPYGLTRGAGFCMCEGAGFDVDGYGRVFYPNLGQFRIEVVDNANNWIGTFGKYGNADSGGKDATVKTPALPLAWPTYVAVSDDYAYVNDTLANRVVRVKLNAAAEESCEVK